MMFRFMKKSCKRMELIDVIGAIHGLFEGKFPFSWVSFAADTAELFALHSQFVEGTGEVRQV